jgi:serine/threonine-protein kinase
MLDVSTPEEPRRRTIAGRYEIGDLLGTGGMGRVFRAWDTRLRRTVAFKLLTSGAQTDDRTLQEAQAQARVEHENVCRVYEVGWGETGEPYIVMQLVEGEALCDAAPKMTFEQRAQVMQKVSEAVHAANRLGVIHRDLKPGNVLIERTADGEWKPFVTDFGLARDVNVVARQASGVVGTPNYMAPEQARGDSARIDRRTDVYGLGATFYEVLSSKFPFDGNPYEILQKVVRDDPDPLGKIDPNIPKDLAAITRKCMEKEPAQRYDSARAVAEDLGRWLDGEPILARPPDLGYRARRWVGRNRTLSIAIGVALLVAAMGSIVSANERARSRQVAERFGQDVKEIEGRMRFALVLPLHDISQEETQVQLRMRQIAVNMVKLGKEGVGPGEYALGRGALALGKIESAREHFQRAWDANYREPECATGLGLSLVELYRAGLHEVSRLPDPNAREKLRAELAQKYRAPAKSALQLGAGASTEPADYVEALIRYCDEDLDGAERSAEGALLQAPWLYEARILLGQVERERGARAHAAGDHAAAEARFVKAREHLNVAVQFGRSDPRAWSELCGLGVDELALQLAGGAIQAAAPEAAFEACGSAVQAAPSRPEGYVRAAAAYRTWASVLLWDGRDARDVLESAIGWARKGMELPGGSLAAQNELGSAKSLLARQEARAGGEAGPSFDEAIAELRSVVAARAGAPVFSRTLAAALLDKASAQLDAEGDADELLQEAEKQLAAVRALDADDLEARALFARQRLLLAAQLSARGQATAPAAAEAVAELGQVARSTQSPADQVRLAMGLARQAELALEAGVDPSQPAQAALAALDRAGAAERGRPEGRLAAARALLALATARFEKHEESVRDCELARTALEAVELRAGPRPGLALLVADAALLQSKQRRALGLPEPLAPLAGIEPRLRAALSRPGAPRRALERRLAEVQGLLQSPQVSPDPSGGLEPPGK